ncbi:MAG: DUF1488 family protein [Pseudomonadota bacterium]
MTLKFPNTSRSYNAVKQCVRFRGYDTVFEISFDLAEGALRRLSPGAAQDETSLLAVFDLHRDRIERVANAVYSRQQKEFLNLSASDF